MQKTAGTSLLRRLRRQFPRDRIYPAFFHEPQIAVSVEHLVAHWRERNGACDLVAGHFPLCTQELLGGGWSTFTILREPVERTLSYLRHRRREVPADRDKSLEAIYDTPSQFHRLIHNHMVKMLSLTTEEMTDGTMTVVTFTPDRLARAKQRLLGVDVVGFQERFEDFCAALQARFGFELGPPVFRNATGTSVVSRSFRDRIAADNALDLELYHWACAALDAGLVPIGSL